MPNFSMPAKQKTIETSPQPERWNFSPQENQTKIIAFSGKLGSGKTSCSNFLHSLAFMHVLGVTEHAFVNDDGELVVKTSEGDYNDVNLDSKDPEVTNYLAQNVWPFIKKYSCADPLKRICIDVLGLDEKLVYGSQSDKLTETHLKWEDMPTFEGELGKNKSKGKVGINVKTGPMTVRDVLEYVGTELFRKMYNDCWANALVKTIQRERPAFAVIDDVRFPNEVFAIKQAGGKVVRLTLTTEEASKNTHDSNIKLDGFEHFDAVIHNDSLTMEESFSELLSYMTNWGFFAVVKQ